MSNQYEAKVYKIWYEDAPDEIYVGSTKRTLAQRMGDHRKSAPKNNGTSLIYETMRRKGINNFQYVLLGSCMVSNMDEQRMFEQSYMTSLKPTLNMLMAYTTYKHPITYCDICEREYRSSWKEHTTSTKHHLKRIHL